MSPEANKTVVRAYIEMWNTGNVAPAAMVLGPTYVDHAHPEVSGLPSFVQALQQLRSTFPDFHITIDTMIAEDQWVAVRATIRRTQQGELRVSRVIRIGALTICPSTRLLGDWWSPEGQAIVEQTLTYLRQRGVERIYLAVLSSGGMGASRLAHRFEYDLAGLILISGADPDAPLTKLPVLVVQGKDDERILARVVERYVAAVGPTSTYLLVEGDHFVLLKEADQVQGAIADWVMEQEAHSAK